jgi:hypothetical protein
MNRRGGLMVRLGAIVLIALGVGWLVWMLVTTVMVSS